MFAIMNKINLPTKKKKIFDKNRLESSFTGCEKCNQFSLTTKPEAI